MTEIESLTMIYLEMSRTENHGGGAWGFGNCLWSPTHKKNGQRWNFWTKVSEVHKGDLILHLKGVHPQANFIGYSVAAGDGYQTAQRPPSPGQWGFAKTFYRADLTNFIPFHQPINLTNIFVSRHLELNSYFEMNKDRKAQKANIFFVKQSGRLQCLNGAYLSEVDTELFTALFGIQNELNQFSPSLSSSSTKISVETGIQISEVFSRLGQARFSSQIKHLYGDRCCFPGCNISDSRFLVASHIARWSDNEHLRGQLGNGLCLCLTHDKAFEIGLFTLDGAYRVYVNPRERESTSTVLKELIVHQGENIRLTDIKPLDDALLEHWLRVDIEP